MIPEGSVGTDGNTDENTDGEEEEVKNYD